MAELMFGVETEYAIAGMSPSGEIDRGEVIRRLMDAASRELTQLPDLHASRGMFLSNAARLYLDCGNHPEYAIGECTSPIDVVRYTEAGHRILAALASSAESNCPPGSEITLFRSNISYSEGTTWGAHESYLHSGPQEALQPHIIPHFATRLIYSSAGGFNPLSRGLEFTLSPRLIAHFKHVVAGHSTTDERAIFNTRQEPLSENYHRLHSICGESLCSNISAYLKVATTALICAMADAGLEPGNGVQLADPLAAMRTVALDVTCKAPLLMADGSHKTALEIQRHYLAQVEAHIGAPFMPAWGAETCQRWKEILDMLDGAPCGVRQTLDWGIKFALMESHAKSRGIRWDELDCINSVIEKVAASLSGRKDSGQSKAIERAIKSKRAMRKEVASLEPLLQSRGLEWEDVRMLLSCREKFLELDWKFAQIGPNGIFQMLDAAGVLNHRILEVDNIELAMTEPPSSGRGRVRGNVIRRLAGTANVHADWQRIVNFAKAEAQVLDLSDPFTHEESWHSPSRAELREYNSHRMHLGFITSEGESDTTRGPSPYSLRQHAFNCYENGDFMRAVEFLRELLQGRFELPSTHCHLVRVLLMMDMQDEARLELNLAWETREEGPTYVLTRVLFLQCLFAMLNHVEIAGIVRQIREAFELPDAHLDWTIRPLIDHMRGHLSDADCQFLEALADAVSDRGSMPDLDEFPQWQEAVVQPLA